MDLLARLNALHALIDREADRLAALHKDRLVCRRGCFACCVDDVTVFEVEAERIRRDYPELLASGDAAPAGGCAFLGAEGECRVYEARPYVCRTQGLPLRWLDEEVELEFRDICVLNDESDPIEGLDPEACWTLGPVEAQLAELQAASSGALRRVALRDLFAKRDG